MDVTTDGERGAYDSVLDVPGKGPMRVGDMTGEDHRAVAEKYRRRAISNFLMAHLARNGKLTGS